MPNLVVNHDTKFNNILEDKIRRWHLARSRRKDSEHRRCRLNLVFAVRLRWREEGSVQACREEKVAVIFTRGLGLVPTMSIK